jgi:hypothetical protein
MSDTENFEVTYASKTDDGETVVLTSTEIAEKWLSEALHKYDPTNRQYSAYLDDKSSQSNVTQELLNQLAKNPQNDVNKIKQINSIVKYYINSDDIIGKVAETIETNVNTESRLSYNSFVSQRNKSKTLEKAKALIDGVNQSIDLKGFIRSSIPTTYTDGTYITYLRHENGDYKIDYYPIGVALISNYSIGNKPVILIDMEALKSKLSNNYPKDKKKRPLFFKNMEEEIKANYPSEIYEAYKNKEQYAKLDIRYSAVCRIGNLNGKYGLTPIFRALPSTLMLKTFEDADRITSKANAKKIIFQKLRKEVMGTDYNKDGFEIMAYSHENLMQAFKQQTVLVTCPPGVENISYVESKTELTDTNVINSYRTRTLSTLGISFLMDTSSQSVSTATISVSQLMKTINKIGEQLETILEDWYKQILTDNGIDIEYAPTVTIIDSEQLEMDVKKDLATLLYSTFNCSLQTSLELLGINVQDEAARRQSENTAGYNEIFKARQTSYTSSGKDSDVNDSGGNPRESKDKSKESYDEEYNKTRKGGA